MRFLDAAHQSSPVYCVKVCFSVDGTCRPSELRMDVRLENSYASLDSHRNPLTEIDEGVLAHYKA